MLGLIAIHPLRQPLVGQGVVRFAAHSCPGDDGAEGYDELEVRRVKKADDIPDAVHFGRRGPTEGRLIERTDQLGLVRAGRMQQSCHGSKACFDLPRAGSDTLQVRHIHAEVLRARSRLPEPLQIRGQSGILLRPRAAQKRQLDSRPVGQSERTLGGDSLATSGHQ